MKRGAKRIIKNTGVAKANVLRKNIYANKCVVSVIPTKIPKLIRGMSYDDMIEASIIATDYIRGVDSRRLTNVSSKASAFLNEIRNQNALNKRRTLNYLNREIVKKNEIESKPTATTKRIYSEIMKSKD